MLILFAFTHLLGSETVKVEYPTFCTFLLSRKITNLWNLVYVLEYVLCMFLRFCYLSVTPERLEDLNLIMGKMS